MFRNPQEGVYTLTPAYDLLNTRLHVPHETSMALELFRGGFESESCRRAGFHTRDDFCVMQKCMSGISPHQRAYMRGHGFGKAIHIIAALQKRHKPAVAMRVRDVHGHPREPRETDIGQVETA